MFGAVVKVGPKPGCDGTVPASSVKASAEAINAQRIVGVRLPTGASARLVRGRALDMDAPPPNAEGAGEPEPALRYLAFCATASAQGQPVQLRRSGATQKQEFWDCPIASTNEEGIYSPQLLVVSV